MENVFTESELNFHFPDNAKWERFDYSNEAGVRKPSGMKFVDLFIEEAEKFLLVEIKNPSTIEAKNHSAREKLITKLEKFTDNELVSGLVEKIRDSYTFLHLMKRDEKPITYIFLIHLEDTEKEKINFLTVKDRLLNKIKHEAKEAWKRDYVKDCAVLGIKEWNKYFPDYKITNSGNEF